VQPPCEEVDATTLTVVVVVVVDIISSWSYLVRKLIQLSIIVVDVVVVVVHIISSWSHLVRNKRGLPRRADFAPARDDDHLLRGSVPQARGLKVLLNPPQSHYYTIILS
jgi:hypothetical protein